MERLNKRYAIIIVILFLLVVGLSGFIIYDKVFKEDKKEEKVVCQECNNKTYEEEAEEKDKEEKKEPINKEEPIKKDEPEEKKDEITLDDTFLLRDRAEMLINDNITRVFPVYKDVNVSQAHKNYAVLYALQNEFTSLSLEEKEQADKCAIGEAPCLGNNPCCDSESIKLEVKVFEENYNKYFEGPITSYDTEIPYNYDKNGYYYYGYCGGISSDKVLYYNYKYTKEQDYYYVYQSVGFIDNEEGKLYADVNKTKFLKTINGNDEYKITSSNYKDYSKYRLKYKKVNDNFIFMAIEKL